MRIYLHIGLEHVGADRLQKVLADKREQLRSKSILFPRSPGSRNHTRLFMAVTDPDHIDPLRFNRGYITKDSSTLSGTILLQKPWHIQFPMNRSSNESTMRITHSKKATIRSLCLV